MTLGQKLEQRLIQLLNDAGVQTISSEDLDHLYKVDFIATHFSGIPKMRPVGVQVTSSIGDAGKLGEFVAKQRAAKYTERSIYLEIEGPDLVPGVDKVVHAALLLFTLNPKTDPIQVLRVYQDLSHEFMPVDQEAPKDAKLRGVFTKIHANGYGFIVSGSESFFVHVSRITDKVLLETVVSIQRTATPWAEVDFEVEFTNMGRDRANTANQSAGDIVRVLAKAGV